jgi:hypothetical protein
LVDERDGFFNIFHGAFNGAIKHGTSDCLVIENGKIFPKDFSTKLMFSTILDRGESGFSHLGPDTTAKDALLTERPVYSDKCNSYLIVLESKTFDERGMAFRRKARNELAKQYGVEKVFIQSERRPDDQGVARFRTEEIPTLLTMLHFRAEGYAVQAPLQTYGGVDDIVAWKSPFIEELRKYRMIEYGCYIDQLRSLKSL